MSITKKMLAKLREGKDRQAREAAKAFVNESRESDNFLTKSKILMEEAVNNKIIDNSEKCGAVILALARKIQKVCDGLGSLLRKQPERYVSLIGVDHSHRIAFFGHVKLKAHGLFVVQDIRLDPKLSKRVNSLSLVRGTDNDFGGLSFVGGRGRLGIT